MSTIDRPLDEIIHGMMLLVTRGRIKGQFARDLEKLCAAAKIGEAYLHEKEKQN